MNRTIPLSYPYYFLKTTVHTTGLLLAISEKFTDKDYDNWVYDVFDKFDNEIYSDILLKQVPLSETLKIGVIKFSIITFTASVERYLKEIIILSLQRSSSLRKKSFEKISLNALKLEKFEDINLMKKSLFDEVVNTHCKGELFSEKFNKVESFLKGKKSNTSDLLTAIDKIWGIRNDIAHSNKKDFDYEIKYKGNTIEISNFPNLEANVALFKLMTDVMIFLEKWEYDVLLKWKVDDFIE